MVIADQELIIVGRLACAAVFVNTHFVSFLPHSTLWEKPVGQGLSGYIVRLDNHPPIHPSWKWI